MNRANGVDKCESFEGYCEPARPSGVPVRALLATAHNTITIG